MTQRRPVRGNRLAAGGVLPPEIDDLLRHPYPPEAGYRVAMTIFKQLVRETGEVVACSGVVNGARVQPVFVGALPVGMSRVAKHLPQLTAVEARAQQDAM